MKRHLSVAQRLEQALASQQVEKLHGKHNYFHARNFSAEEWSTIWSQSDNTAWAHGFGRMRGFDQIWYNSVTMYDYSVYETYIDLVQMFPEIGGLDPRPVMELSMHTLVNGIIEVAEDGKTARSSFVTPGMLYDCINSMAVKQGISFWERYGSDFVCEDGEWKYLHEHVCPDFGMPFDFVNMAADEYERAVNPALGGPMAPPAGRDDRVELADPGPLHQKYSIFQPVQNTVPWPEPYVSMDDQHSYATLVEPIS